MNKYQKPLTEREYEVASVAGDLLIKGSPEHRIALHCVHRGLNKLQTEVLMYKLVNLGAVNLETAHKVVHEFVGAAQAAPDERHKEGHNLKIKIWEQREYGRKKG